MQELLRTLHSDEGQLFYVKDGCRYSLADCSVRIEIHSQKERLPKLGEKATYQTYYLTIALCEDMDMKQEANAALLRSVSRLELTASLYKREGGYERFVFDNMDLIHAGDGEWTFEINEDYALIRRLLAEF